MKLDRSWRILDLYKRLLNQTKQEENHWSVQKDEWYETHTA